MNSLIDMASYPGGRQLLRSEASALSADDLAALERAARDLERTSLAMRLTSVLGRQFGAIGLMLPPHFAEIVNKAAQTAIKSALAVAVRSLNGKPVRDTRRLHKGAAVLAGAAGGSLGLSALPVELPFTTTIMLRSIADIARSEGEDLSQPSTALACLEVFALGGPSQQGLLGRSSADASLETGYFAVRALLAKSVSEATRHFVQRGVGAEAAPVLVRLVNHIGARFGLVVSEKVAAQSIPVIGGVCGAAINYAFVDHFQTLARCHFTILRLERRYGASVVRAEYEEVLKFL